MRKVMKLAVTALLVVLVMPASAQGSAPRATEGDAWATFEGFLGGGV
jgi:hypothetical protein